jgi:hypothetical protein
MHYPKSSTSTSKSRAGHCPNRSIGEAFQDDGWPLGSFLVPDDRASEVLAHDESYHHRSLRHYEVSILLGLNLNPSLVRYVSAEDNEALHRTASDFRPDRGTGNGLEVIARSLVQRHQRRNQDMRRRMSKSFAGFVGGMSSCQLKHYTLHSRQFDGE